MDTIATISDLPPLGGQAAMTASIQSTGSTRDVATDILAPSSRCVVGRWTLAGCDGWQILCLQPAGAMGGLRRPPDVAP